MPDDATLHLLLARGDDHAPELPDGLPLSSVIAGRVEGLPTTRSYGGPPGGGPPDNAGDMADDIPCDIWGLIVPEGAEGDRLLKLVEPLIKAREQRQGSAAPVYRVPARGKPMSIAEACAWRRRVYDDGASLDPARYQLILGDLGQVPFSIQQVQSTDGYVGRLCFADDAGYAAYADKVLRAEASSPTAAGRIVAHAAHDGSRAMEMGLTSLVEPGLALLQQSIDAGRCLAGGIVAYTERNKPGLDVLLSRVASPDPCAFLTLSHGLGGGFKTAEEQRATQGAMAFGAVDTITAERVAKGPFMPGGLWLMFACFGAGTPSDSAYQPWLDALRTLGTLPNAPDVRNNLSMGPPFIAALPQKALANPEGPLGFIGHVDLAWTYSYLGAGKDAGARPAPFMRALRTAINGEALGLAYRDLFASLLELDAALSGSYELEALASATDPAGKPSGDDRAARCWQWMTRQDLGGFILLGDPAARLPVNPTAARVESKAR
jgi:hypothetical protein